MNKNEIYSIILAILMILSITIISSFSLVMLPWQIAISSLMIIIPIFLTGLYSSKINKIHRLQLYNSESLLFKIISGNTLSIIFWLVSAIISGALIFGQLTTKNFEFNLKSLLIYFILYK